MAGPPKPLKPLVLEADDGTPLSYYQLGSGPSLVIIPGAMSSALSQLELAFVLSASYTVYLLSRRGRGLSGPYPSSITDFKNSLLLVSDQTAPPRDSIVVGRVYDPKFSQNVLETDLRDLAALVSHTGATSLLGISGGALLVLAACSSLPFTPDMSSIQKAIIFDPPLLFNTPQVDLQNMIDLASIRRYEAEIKSSDTPSALVTAMKIVQLGPGWLRSCPRFIIRFFTSLIISAEAKEQARKKAAGEEEEGKVTMEQLAPVLRYDFALAEALMGDAARFRDVALDKDVLLLGGGNSPEYLKNALRVLERAITGSESVGRLSRVEIAGVGHELLENKRRNGKIEMGINVIKEFLGEKNIR